MRLFALWLIVMATCAFAPSGTTVFDPPPHYREVYDSALACSKPWWRTKTPKPYYQVRWRLVPGKDFKCKKMRCLGYTQMNKNTIYIASEWATTDWVVRHELVHLITNRSHWAGDTVLWGKACHATWGYLPQDSLYKP